jgi:DNA polymerase (family 10)
MPIQNAAIAAIFSEIADLPKPEQANPFCIRAYRNAARDVRALVKRDENLTELRKQSKGTR